MPRFLQLFLSPVQVAARVAVFAESETHRRPKTPVIPIINHLHFLKNLENHTPPNSTTAAVIDVGLHLGILLGSDSR